MTRASDAVTRSLPPLNTRSAEATALLPHSLLPALLELSAALNAAGTPDEANAAVAACGFALCSLAQGSAGDGPVRWSCGWSLCLLR